MSYLNNTANKKSAFKIIPSIETISSTNSSKLFEEAMDRIYSRESEILMKEVLTIIYEKLNTKDEEFRWTSNDYKSFKKEINKVDIKDINLLGSSIKKSVTTKNTDIYNQLELFANKTTWYPRKERVKENNKYIYINEEISISDCFYIINNLNSYIKQYISRFLNTIKKDINEDFSIIIENVKNDLLDGYIKEYSYLKDFPLFIDIYNNGYNEILKRLEKIMYEYKSDLAYQKNEERYRGSDTTAQRATSLKKYRKAHLNNNTKS